MVRYLDKVIRPLVLVLPRNVRYINTFNVKNRDEDKNNKLMYFSVNDEKLLEKYKIIWTMIEDLKIIEFGCLPVYDNTYVKPKIK